MGKRTIKPAREALRLSELRYRRLFEAAQDGILILDADTGAITDVNPYLSKILGYSRAEFLEKKLWDVGAFKDVEASKADFRALQRNEYIRYNDLPLKTKDGRLLQVEFISNVYPVDHKDVIQCNIRDATRRVQAEEALRESEERYRNLIEMSPDAIAVHQKGKFVYVNPAGARLIGAKDSRELVGKSILDIVHPDYRSDIIQRIAQTVEGKDAPLSEEKFIALDGTVIDVEVAAIPFTYQSKPATQVVIHNITARKRAEQAIRESEANLKEAQELGKIGNWEFDVERQTTTWSDQMFELYERDPALGPHRAEEEAAYSSPEQTERLHEYIRRAVEQGQASEYDVEARLPSGRLAHLTTKIRPIKDETGKVVRLFGTVQDFSERRRAEEQIHSRTDELLKLYELSRALTNADDLDQVLRLVTRHAAESVHSTFARIALLEGNELVARAVYPIRALGLDVLAGKRTPLAELPYCRRALEQHEPIILHAGDPNIGGAERAALLLGFVHTVCLVPLTIGGDAQDSKGVLGLLMLGEARGEEREPFTPEKVHMASSIGDQAASATRRMLLRDETERRLQHVGALHTIDQAISGSIDLHVTLNIVLEQITTQLGVDAASVLLLNPHTQTLDYVSGRGFNTRAIERTRLRLGEGLAGRAALERRTINAPDLVTRGTEYVRAELLAGENFVAYFGVPLIAKGKVVGVLDIYNRSSLTPDPEWLDFMEALAGQAAIAIDNGQLFDGLQRSNNELALAYETTIEGWSRALDLRDKETEGHTLRVTETTLQLARAMGLDVGELVHIRRGALLHDIGKMGVPDSILLKPGPLTDDEWVTMRKHPVYAYEMLSPIPYLKLAMEIPYCHHERWDGAGYPRGLKGEQIPLVARIFAVVDVWDALRSDRPYRGAWTNEQVREHIRVGAGSHFDPTVAKAFLNMKP